MNRWRYLFAVLVALGLVAAACGGSDDDGAETSADGDSDTEVSADAEDSEDEATDEAPDDEGDAEDAAAPGDITPGGTITFAFSAGIRHLNGTVQSGYATAVPGTQVNASPLLFDEQYQPQPYLAESWDVSDDGLTVTLNLRENAVFHDGEPITSEDVAFSILTSQANHPFKPMFEPVQDVDASDPLTVVITLSKPHPAILMAMSPGLLPIIPQHIFDDGQDIQTHPRNGGDDFVGSGPFQVVEYDAAEIIRLEKFDDFFIEGQPYLDEIIIDIVADPNTLVLGVDNGDYDMATLPNTNVEQFQGDDRFTVEAKGHEAIGQIDWLFLNTRSEALSTVEARQAISLAIDQQAWRDIVELGYNQANVTGIQNASPFYNKDAPNFDERDVDRAMELLDSVGLGDGFELDMPATAGKSLQTAEFVKQNLEDIGVTVNIRQLPDFPTWAAEIAGGTYDMTWTQVWNWGDPVIGVHRSYNCDNRIDPPGVIWSNNSWYCNEDVDALLDQAGSTFDNDERQDFYFQASELINEDAPLVYLGKPDWYQVRKTRVQNPPTGVWGFMSPWHEVWLSE
jgi:peptide/nickel transport system substrate-binding protein